MTFHRVFVCAKCLRVIAGCLCPGHDYVEEKIDSCAFCVKEKK